METSTEDMVPRTLNDNSLVSSLSSTSEMAIEALVGTSMTAA